MKNFLFICLSVFALSTASAVNPVQKTDHGFPPCSKKITLYSGTVILLECNEKIELHNVTVGQTILFKVKMDVKAEHETAIATGALAIGTVKSMEESTYNHPAEIRVELKYVQAVDGQQVALNGNELTATGETRGRGNGSTIRFGTDITAHVTNNIDIKAN